MRRTAILTLTLLTGACFAPRREDVPPRVQVVDQLGRVPSTGSMDPRFDELRPPTAGGSRLALQDLYDRANDERDSYLIELEQQARALEIAADRQRELAEQHRELQRAFILLEGEKLGLDARRERLMESLITARIRRLEAEIAWLVGSLEHEFSMPPEARPASAHTVDSLEDPR